MIEKLLLAIGAFCVWLMTVTLIAIVGAVPLMLLWDWLMPTLFHLPEITLFQAWGLGMLSAILFQKR